MTEVVMSRTLVRLLMHHYNQADCHLTIERMIAGTADGTRFIRRKGEANLWGMPELVSMHHSSERLECIIVLCRDAWLDKHCLKIRQFLPETVKSQMTGEPVTDLVRHPLLDDDMRITSIHEDDRLTMVFLKDVMIDMAAARAMIDGEGRKG